MSIETYEGLGDMPLYDGDLEARDGIPASAQKFIDAVTGADGMLIATPEYNFSMPAGLKNAIDWASRPNPHPFKDKPLAIMGASAGPLGTARAQYHLRMTMTALDCLILRKPEIFVGLAQSKFDEKGNLTDEVARDLIAQMMDNFKDWIERLR